MPSVASIPIQLSANVRLDATGNGRVSLGPAVVREYWDLISATVSVVTATSEAVCALYQATGPTPGQAMCAPTATGSTGDTCGLAGQTLLPGQSVLAVWSGGDPNATATLVISATKGRYGR
jgi:hypothetical protein